MPSTDKAWEQWGKQDPYFGVLAHDRFAAAQIDRNRDEFFATGRAFVAGLIGQYEHHFGALPRGRALDHGSGVGRLTIPLAAHFRSVLGLDISPGMIAEAEANASRSQVANVDFALADDGLSNAAGDYDFVNSHLVLQHVPVKRGVPILLRLVDAVKPGGGFHIHLCMRTDRGPLRLLYWASATIPGVKLWQNICAGRRWNAPAMQMNHYPLARVLRELASRGITQVVMTTERHDRFITCSLLGRKP